MQAAPLSHLVLSLPRALCRGGSQQMCRSQTGRVSLGLGVTQTCYVLLFITVNLVNTCCMPDTDFRHAMY